MIRPSGMVQRIGRYFLAGVFALLPLVITVAVAVWFTGFISQFMGPGTVMGRIIEALGLRVSSHETVAYVIGWLLVLAGIFLFGVFVEAGARKYIQRIVKGVMQRIPIIGSVYGTATQLVELIGRKGEDELKGMSVVYCFFGGERGAVFLALMPTPDKFKINDMDYHAILIPSAPVPFGGSLLLVPSDSVQLAHLSVEKFINIYLSMGSTGAQFIPKSE